MKLKNCPFCGGEKIETGEIEVAGTDSTYIVCVNCESCTKLHYQKEDAIKAWNRREPIDKIVEQLEEYKNLECDDIDEDIDQEAEDAEELYDIGRSQGKLEAYLNAIEIVKGGAENDS